MSRNQIITLGSCTALFLGLYLFASTKKPKEKVNTETTEQALHDHSAEQPTEKLDIAAYLIEINAKINDKATVQKIAEYEQAKNYKALMAEYQKLDKPLALAHYAVLMANAENNPVLYVQAGDYNSTLMQTAPDEKAKEFLSNNAVACYQKAVDIDSNNVDNKIRLASAFMENGATPMQGVSILLEIVKRDSTNENALLMLGKFGIISGQYEKAIVRLEKILYLHPQNSEAMLLLAEAYNGQGNKNKAIELLERCKKTIDNPKAKEEIDNYIKSIKQPKS